MEQPCYKVLMDQPCYTLNYSIAETHNLCFYEVQRNEYEVPFTVVVRDFDKVGHRQFFIDIFASREWDEDRVSQESPDNDFLAEVWKHFGLEGEYTPPLETPTGQKYIFRKSLKEVIAQLNKNEDTEEEK